MDACFEKRLPVSRRKKLFATTDLFSQHFGRLKLCLKMSRWSHGCPAKPPSPDCSANVRLKIQNHTLKFSAHFLTQFHQSRADLLPTSASAPSQSFISFPTGQFTSKFNLPLRPTSRSLTTTPASAMSTTIETETVPGALQIERIPSLSVSF